MLSSVSASDPALLEESSSILDSSVMVTSDLTLAYSFTTLCRGAAMGLPESLELVLELVTDDDGINFSGLAGTGGFRTLMAGLGVPFNMDVEA